MGFRPIGVAKDPTVVVEVTPVVGLAKVASTAACDVPHADRLGPPPQAAPVAAVTLPVASSVPPVVGGQEVGALLSVADGEGAVLLVAALGAATGAAAAPASVILPRAEARARLQEVAAATVAGVGVPSARTVLSCAAHLVLQTVYPAAVGARVPQRAGVVGGA